MWTPVIDISVHQGNVDFGVMRSRGVAGVIIRATHGKAIDNRLDDYVEGARRAGYADSDLGFYSFINPKRGSGAECATATVEAIRGVLGHTDTVYMLDIESYVNEPPNAGSAPTFGAQFGAWLREHISAVRDAAPDMTIIGYANESYWSGQVPGQPAGTRWIDDLQLATQLEWIVPRYHVQPSEAVKNDPDQLKRWQVDHAPPDPGEWGDWAFNVNTKRPQPPNGVPWAGWQFSAGFNGQGAPYGTSSGDLDLNIVSAEAWSRWGRGSPTRTGRRTTLRRGDVQMQLVAGPDVLLPGESIVPNQQRVSRDGRSVLVHQGDGNVVLYKGRTAVWATDTSGRTTAVFVMQGDGNLVLYDTAGAPLWDSQTNGNPAAGMRVENDGKVVVYTTAMRPLWSSTDAPPTRRRRRRAAGPRTAVVRPNDGWITIARRELGSAARWRELARLNGGEARVLHPGDVVVLPA